MTQIRCPKVLLFFTFFMIGFPIFYLLFAAFIFELSSKGILSVVLSPLYYIATAFWVFTGVGLQRMRHWSWYTFGIAQFFTAYLNALNLVQYSDSQFKGLAFIVAILIQVYVFLNVSRYIRVPFLFPHIRWWESGIAGMNHLKVEVLHMSSVTGTSHAQILDISPRGCFIKSPFDFEPFEKIKIRMDSYGHAVDVAGHVVWSARSTVTHPKGIGVQFVDLDRAKRRKVKIIYQRFLKERNGSTHVSRKLSRTSA
jgi:Tfp pilus assembly protein PilZ